MKHQGQARHVVTPRALVFLERDGRLLLLEGGRAKWWAGRLNGLGGSIEPGEDALAAARREVREETGLEAADLSLAALVHVSAEPAVFLFVFRGTLPPGALRPTEEGRLHWTTAETALAPETPLMPDLRFLLPRVLELGPDDPPLHVVFDHRRGLVLGTDGQGPT
jgi:8-oxo-dGTP diphosphatase